MPLNTIAFPIGHFPSGAFPEGHWPALIKTESNFLSLPPSYIIGKYLISESYLEIPPDESWPVYISHMPDLDSNIACVYDSIPVVESFTRTNARWSRYGIMIHFKSFDYEIARDKAEEVSKVMNETHEVSFQIEEEYFKIKSVTPFTGVSCVGQDDLRRYLFTLNFMVVLASLI